MTPDHERKRYASEGCARGAVSPLSVRTDGARALLAVSLVTGLFAPASPVRADDSAPFVRYGTQYGECIGYCVKSIELHAAKVVFSASGWHPTKQLAPVRLEASLTQEDRTTLLHLLANASVEALPAVIGCPDCADGGAEWVELPEHKPDNFKRVTFEKGKPPHQLARLALWLETLQNRFQVPRVP